MSTWKLSKSEPEDTSEDNTVHGTVDADSPPPAALEVDVLEIDVDSGLDCDPYNRTGQFCVPTFDKRDK